MEEEIFNVTKRNKLGEIGDIIIVRKRNEKIRYQIIDVYKREIDCSSYFVHQLIRIYI